MLFVTFNWSLTSNYFLRLTDSKCGIDYNSPVMKVSNDILWQKRISNLFDWAWRMSFKRQACKTILVHYAPNFPQNVWQLIASHRKCRKTWKFEILTEHAVVNAKNTQFSMWPVSTTRLTFILGDRIRGGAMVKTYGAK